MSEPSATHSTFTIERTLATSPRRAFAFWSDPAMKRRWAACHENWGTVDYHLDFRVGGSEVSNLMTPEGVAYGVRGLYLDIVQDKRIVYAYDMLVGEARISVSLATVLFVPAPGGTLMTFIEQVAFLDGHADHQGRKEGSEIGFDRLVIEVERDEAVTQ